MAFSPEGRSGETGGTLEWGVFGGIGKGKVMTAIKEMGLTTEEFLKLKDKGYLPYDKSIDLVKRIQNVTEKHNPANPEKMIVRDIKDFLEEFLKKKSENVRFYSALKTPLDIMHGVDAFFEIDLEKEEGKEQQKPVVVTMDITMRAKEGDKDQKANVLIRMPDGAPLSADDDYEAKVKQIARAVKDAFENIKSGDKFFKTAITI
ncbi:MAG TPA: hypothetical protein P5056_00970 [Candidatus Paceibacterota bacterium]|nr:hypothetical protein [Candidatus Paceibacterota bacterium]